MTAVTAASLPPMDVAARLPAVRDSLAGAGCDALIVTKLTNIRYLTGFTGSAGLLLLLPDATVLVTDGRYETQAVEQLGAAGLAVEVAVGRSAAAQRDETQAAFRRSGGDGGRVGLEAEHVSWARQRAFASEWLPGVELVPTEGLVETRRRVKDGGEIARIGRAAAIADAALGNLRDRLAEGPTEAEFGRALDFEMRRLGAAGSSFETIVASGPNAAKPHARPSDRAIGRGEPVVIDFGAVVDGYCSDMTRTLWVDSLDSDELGSLVGLVAESQSAGVRAVRSGVRCAEVDAACRDVIVAAGRGSQFVHGTGHGVGLDIHEAPAVSATSSDTLAAGHVVTVEPGVYVPGLGGVRIEDTVVVTDDGCQLLTTSPKDRYA
jgi:Xaa-Pro aminopeptidase